MNPLVCDSFKLYYPGVPKKSVNFVKGYNFANVET